MESMSNLTKKDVPEVEGVAPETTTPVEEVAATADAMPLIESVPAQKAEPSIDTLVNAAKAAASAREQVDLTRENQPPAVVAPGGVMTVDEAQRLGMDVAHAEVIDVEKEQLEAEHRRYVEGQQAKQRETVAMFADALAEEEARVQRLDNTLEADDETKERLLGETEARVTYAERMKDSKASTNPEIDPYDLMPGYTDEDEPEEKIKDPDETPDPSDDEYGQYIRDLQVAEIHESENPPVRMIRETRVDIVPSGRTGKNHAPLGDQAFMNAITKFKKDNFGRVTTPLPNSGFMADVVGTGVVDLQNLYLNVDQNMTTYDYQLEQMRTVIRNVVGTSPKVSAENLQNMIHFQDFQMLAFAHICATLRSIETVTNCTDCGKPFRITSKPNMLLMNLDELSERRAQIESAPNIEACSLMTTNREVPTSIGIMVTLGHPSYADMIRSIRGFQEYSKNMTESDRKRFESMLKLLYMIRKMKLPTGTYANNIFQMYQTLLLLSDDDLELVNHEANEMRNQIIVPKFGIPEVKCPHCGKIIKDVAYDSLLELLFYHTTISSYLKNPEA